MIRLENLLDKLEEAFNEEFYQDERMSSVWTDLNEVKITDYYTRYNKDKKRLESVFEVKVTNYADNKRPNVERYLESELASRIDLQEAAEEKYYYAHNNYYNW